MSQLYNLGPLEFDVVVGETVGLEIRAPRRGTIRSIVVELVGGKTNSGTFQLFDSRAAVASLLPTEDSSASISAEENLVGHAISAPLNIVSGSLVQTGLQFAYVNRDGSNANPVCRMWCKLSLSGSTELVTIRVSMTIEPPNFR